MSAPPPPQELPELTRREVSQRELPHDPTGAARRLKLLRCMLRTVDRYRLIEAGDHILVAVSGGKDSYTMLDLLLQAQRRSPVSFQLTAVHLDQRQPGYDGRPLAAWLSQSGARFEILHEDTYSIVKGLVSEGETYCAPCSRLRRGILYSCAARLGCNKIALGHHREDTLHTLLLNLLYAGKLQAMPASYRTDDGRFQVIRPLIECAEPDIAAHAAAVGYPILPCNLCGSQDGLKRREVAALVSQLESTIPDVRAVMLSAIRNVRPSHLLDRRVATAWAQRPADPPTPASLGPGRRLPMLREGPLD
jgi:tRNA 2-thiocytidine biosynthesis protein TtcA